MPAGTVPLSTGSLVCHGPLIMRENRLVNFIILSYHMEVLKCEKLTREEGLESTPPDLHCQEGIPYPPPQLVPPLDIPGQESLLAGKGRAEVWHRGAQSSLSLTSQRTLLPRVY